MKKMILLGLSFSLFGCTLTYDQLGLLERADKNIDVLLNEKQLDNEVNFTTLSQSALQSCSECHKEGNFNILFESVVVARKEKIWRAVESNAMPPADKGFRPLTDCQKETLYWWLNSDGSEKRKFSDFASCQSSSETEQSDQTPTPEPTLTPAPSPTPSPEPVDESWTEGELTFATLNEKILAPKCAKCHHDDKIEGTNLQSWVDLQIGGLLFLPVESNFLYKRVTSDNPERVMPPPKSDIPRLTPKEVDYLKRWLEAGAPK